MTRLSNISDYIEQTANIIGGVLELDVLIVDQALQILGDSDLESISQDQCIRKDSILATVIEDREMKVLTSKDDHEGCRACKNKAECNVVMIIAIPIIYRGQVVGSLGVIANSEHDKEKMLSNKANFLKFIDRMLELIINKLDEEKAFEEITLLNKRVEVILDSMDHYLVLVSERGEILQANENFKSIFSDLLKVDYPKVLTDFLDFELSDRILFGNAEIKYKEIKIGSDSEQGKTAKNSAKTDFVLSSKPVILNQKERGAILSIRSFKDIADELTELYTHSLDVAFHDLVGESKVIKDIKDKIRQISASSSTVLIDGETGTGKEVVARLIHNTSSRKDQPFVAINCSAIPEDLMESELFGYEDGAFTGAKKGGKIGKFHLADGGTIFLDEIGEMALHLQAKLLRVLQEQQVTKIGGLKSTKVDVRIIAATNRKLEDCVKSGMFREDLYYRLKVIPISIPPLRERKDDLSLLIDYFLNVHAKRINKKIHGFSDDALKVLMNHPWKGNVRELRNVIEFSINMTASPMIRVSALPSDMLQPVREDFDGLNIEENTRRLMRYALDQYGTTTTGKEAAAKALGISLATLYRKMKEYGLQ